MEQYIYQIISMLFGAGLFGFIQFLIKRKDEQQARLEERQSMYNDVADLLHKVEKDSVRCNLLILMNLYPDREDKIMQVAEHYFKDLNGNWFVTDIFEDWLNEKDLDKPDWIK